MKHVKLTRPWWKWRQNRYKELSAQGLNTDDALFMSKAEAVIRMKLARAIGAQNARDLKLVCVGAGEQMKICLMGSLSVLNDQQLHNLETHHPIDKIDVFPDGL